MKTHYKVLIVGGGTAGITTAARLLRQSKAFESDVAIVDPADKHYYQPLWTLVGAGVSDKEETEREMQSVMPEGVDWIQDAVETFDPDNNAILTAMGQTYTYDYMVVGAGIQINWDGIKGLKETLGKNGVCSNYSFEHVDYTWETIRNVKGGNAIFTHPNSPIKCGGAPQKIMYLAEDAFRNMGVRDNVDVIFGSANPAIFDVKKYRDVLETVIDRKRIDTRFRHNLIEVKGEEKEAVFENLETGDIDTFSFEMLHVTPPMEAPTFIKKSPLADEKGWVDVNKHTLQHTRYSNVFGLGDSSNLPTSKTGAAIRKQAPTVVENIMALIQKLPMTGVYNGYTSCPVVTGYNRLVLAEFDYDKNPSESMPFNQAKERRSMYMLKKDMLPLIYWDGMLKGVM
ncbi:pyridine nucleotide-disulfide oxidoreductase [Pontibacillus yanchengensis]|uniref:Pyridine nucleotide-disulfide oxidoreductase n=1 Tax=Pontibacillus yanchengensis TaxID=462910 RepID=A0ACC7VL37_9BACI|nr:FAD/NAD(P)-binding oxidoreductase [Pontibacillus yanchengensis]MYL55488.1 pyridine nucleotide-disulfide oxidoreductase [Pontibacillus yanchengensis]